MNIPFSIIAGDSLSFSESYPDYLASDGWAASYVLLNKAGKIDFPAVADGDDFKFSVVSADTESWLPGEYQAVLVLAKDSERATLMSNTVTVKPNPLSVASMDGRTQAKKILDSLRSAYEKFVESGGVVQEVTVNGRVTKFRTADDILKQINYWQLMVNSEIAATQSGANVGFGTRILTRL